MKKSLSLLKGLFVAAMLCVSVAANADTFYYRTFHVVAQDMTGNGSIYITTQNDASHGEYAKFDTDLESGFACTLSNGYGRLFFNVTPDPGFSFQGVKVFTVGQDAPEPIEEEIEAAPFAEYKLDETDVENGVYSVVIFPGDAQGETDEEKSAWSPYGVYGGTDYAGAVATPCNENPDAYVYYYFADPSGINEIANTTTSKTTIYSLDGRQQKLTKGINIVRNSNAVRKVIVK
ncbi:MAG: hypothetical protein MJY52_02525 [Bacteroidaceae bacterium]|nr:hypothetical protein [Bacteroidaceae bacterium]